MDKAFANSRYFFPARKNSKKMYGLYSPVCDCFLLLSSELEVLESLTYLMFNQMKLIVIRIDAAPNYTPMWINNLCSTNWTMSDFSNIRITEMPNTHNILHEEFSEVRALGRLIKCSIEHHAPDQKLIEIMFFAHYVIKWYKTEPSFFYRKVYNLIDLPFPDKFIKLKEIEKNCYRLIYTCSDYRDIENRVLGTLVKEHFQ